MEKFDSIFRNKMEDKEQTPPSANWAKLEMLLDAQEEPKRKNRKPIFWIAASLVPFFIALFWFLYKPMGEFRSHEMAQSPTSSTPRVRNQKSGGTENSFHSQLPEKLASVDEGPANYQNQAKTTPGIAQKDRRLSFGSNSGKSHHHAPALTIETTDPKSEPSPNLSEEQLAQIAENNPTAVSTDAASESPDEVAYIAYLPQKTASKEAQSEWAEVEFRLARRQNSIKEGLAAFRQDGFKNVGTIADAKETLASLIGYRTK